MKVAVCISGQCRGQPNLVIDNLKEAFPNYDFFYHAWDNSPQLPTNTKVMITPEPLYRYNPAGTEIYPSWYQYGQRRTKYGEIKGLLKPWDHLQILAHANQQLFYVPQEYDMIVRARWDVMLNYVEDWESVVADSYNTNTVKGWRAYDGFRYSDMKKIRATPILNKPSERYKEPPVDCGLCLLQDQLLMFRREMFDPIKCFELYNKNRLRGTEFGWSQMLMENNCFFPNVYLSHRGIAKIYINK